MKRRIFMPTVLIGGMLCFPQSCLIHSGATDKEVSTAATAPKEEQGPQTKEAAKASTEKPTQATAKVTAAKPKSAPATAMIPDNQMRRIIANQEKAEAKAEVKGKEAAVLNEAKAKTEIKPAKTSTTAKRSKTKAELRFVSASTLNVRSAPSKDAPIVGTLKKGSSFRVTMHGKWAKIGPQQFALAKYLGKTEPEATDSGWDFAMSNKKGK